MYILPKLHKIIDSVPAFPPILSSLETYNNQLAKYLGKLLDDVIPNDHSAMDTFSFVQELKTVSVTNDYMGSYDVANLLTNIPLEETIHLTTDLLFEAKRDLKISRKDSQTFFEFPRSQANFLFNGNMYDQNDDVTIGLSLTHIIANIFMGYHDKGWIRDYSYGKLIDYKGMFMIYFPFLKLKVMLFYSKIISIDNTVT